MNILGILVFGGIVFASTVVGLALCKSLAITDDLNGTRE